MNNVKELIKEELNLLSKEELVDVVANICTIYVAANITTKLSNANCIQHCINNVQTNFQEIENCITQKVNKSINYEEQT
jgi:hypothetical protein